CPARSARAARHEQRGPTHLAADRRCAALKGAATVNSPSMRGPCDCTTPRMPLVLLVAGGHGLQGLDGSNPPERTHPDHGKCCQDRKDQQDECRLGADQGRYGAASKSSEGYRAPCDGSAGGGQPAEEVRRADGLPRTAADHVGDCSE